MSYQPTGNIKPRAEALGLILNPWADMTCDMIRAPDKTRKCVNTHWKFSKTH